MKKLSVSVREDHVERLDARQDDGEATSRSDALRQILDEYEEMRTEYDDVLTECEELRTRLESREDRIETLEDQLRRRSHVEEKVDVLATRFETQQAQRARQRAREDALASAPPWRRFKWWATGTDPADTVDREDDLSVGDLGE